MCKQAVLIDLYYSPKEYWDGYQMFSLDLMHLPIGGNLTVHLLKNKTTQNKPTSESLYMDKS